MFLRNGLKLLSSIQRHGFVAEKSLAPAVLSRHISVGQRRDDSFKIQDLEDFKEKVENSKNPIIVDFFATWCNPCKMLTPRIETVIAEKSGKINLAKVDIDELTDLALEYEVSSVPVLVAFKNGKEAGRMIGLQDVDKLRTFVNKFAPS